MKKFQAGAGARAGDTVKVELDIDRAVRTVDVPVELEAALQRDAAAATAFAALAPSHRKEYADWVGSAKKSVTRVVRADKAVEMVRERKRMP